MFIKKEVLKKNYRLVVLGFFCVRKDKLEGCTEVTGKEAKPYTVT